MSERQSRRSFFTSVASAAGLAAVAAQDAAAQSVPPSAGPFDMKWLEQVKGKHKQLYDLGAWNLAEDGRPLRFCKNFLDTFRDVYKMESPEQPSIRNIFYDEGSDISVKAMQARGTIFWQCNVALGNVAQQLADQFKMPFAEVRADLIAGLNPGVRLMPSHVMSLALAQERGFTYMRP